MVLTLLSFAPLALDWQWLQQLAPSLLHPRTTPKAQSRRHIGDAFRACLSSRHVSRPTFFWLARPARRRLLHCRIQARHEHIVESQSKAPQRIAVAHTCKTRGAALRTAAVAALVVSFEVPRRE